MSRRKSRSNRNSFKHHYGVPKIRGNGDRTSRLNFSLIDLSNKTENQLEYWKAFQQFLVDERETRIERIHESLKRQSISGFNSDAFVRIIDSRYQNRPLSSYGSIVVPPGQRFNFGEISSYHQRFQALYLASNFKTAAAERFLRDQKSDNAIDEQSLMFRLDPQASFSSYRVRVSNLTIIDIRDEENLKPFLNVISEIKTPRWLEDLARSKRQPQPRTVQTVDQLKTILFDPNFVQWGSLIDQPSASQWFGYYVRAAKIQGILYSSVRNRNGFNLAIFPDNLIETEAKIELLDPAAGVEEQDRIMNSENALFHMQPSMKKDALIINH